ncbi:MerR family transcriptional regulator [Pseudonocardia acaciae]|uniref:MerR family transcriptional regulator n=1 Tax=Pseudonocardia acaciae TaxID=551276 RepID=UPI00048A92D3|nr:MerR family transcriptional regulator [Pseudonocardia acaciae]
MKSTDGSLGVGEAARRFGLAPHVLRHWESVGLLAPSRVAGDRRRYGPEDLFRIGMVVLGKRAGFGLDRMRELLSTGDAARQRAALRAQRDELVRRIADARAALGMIDHALECDHDDISACPNFQAAVRAHPALAERLP